MNNVKPLQCSFKLTCALRQGSRRLASASFGITLCTHRVNMLEQQRIGRYELGSPQCIPETLTVETIQLANPTEPLKIPRLDFRVAFTDSHKFTTHVSSNVPNAAGPIRLNPTIPNTTAGPITNANTSTQR